MTVLAVEASRDWVDDWPVDDDHGDSCPDLPAGLEDLMPGAELAARLAGIDRSVLCGYHLVIVLQGWSRQVSHSQAELYATMMGVAYRSYNPDAGRTGGIDEYASAEIGAALVLTRRAADLGLGLACDLERLPQVWEALHCGRIDLARAKIICQGTAHLHPDRAGQVAAVLLQTASRLTTGQLGERLRRLTLTIDPDDAKQRYEQGVEQRRVDLYSSPDGTAELVGSQLPADRAAAALKHIHKLAKRARRHGDPRSIDQIKADLYLELLEGNRPGTAAVGGVVDLTVDLATLTGLTDTPGEIPGYGPVIADVARQVAARQPRSEWRVTVSHPDSGEVLWNGTTRRRPTAAQRRHLQARHRSCVFPGCRVPALDCDIDHTHPYARGGRTTSCNLEPLCRRHHRVKDRGRWRLRQPQPGLFIWTSPLGHRYTVEPRPP